MIRKKELPVQEEFWVARHSICKGEGSGFYDILSGRLDDMGFGDKVRELCATYYKKGAKGRPPVDPEVFFKMFLVGFFEGIGSERGIASRCDDSLSIRRFLRYDLTEPTPDHSTLSRIRNRLPMEVFTEVFTFSLVPLLEEGLLKGERIGLDSSIIEANASHENLVRRVDGKTYQEYIRELAREAGIDPDDRAAVHRFDRNRKDKRTSNEEWYSPNDPDAKFGPKKDGAWDMTHKVESAVDLDSGAILSVEVQPSDKCDSTNMAAHFETAAQMVDYTKEKSATSQEEPQDTSDAESPMEVSGGQKEEDESGEEEQQRRPQAVADKGYHKNEEIHNLKEAGLAPVIAEPHGKEPPKDKSQAVACAENQANRKSEEGRQSMSDRAEKVERSFRHVLDHGGARRTTLCGHPKIRKRFYMTVFGFNLSILFWNKNGVGTKKQMIAGNRNPEWVKTVQILHVLGLQIVKMAIRILTKTWEKYFGKELKNRKHSQNPAEKQLQGIFWAKNRFKSTVS